MEQRIHFCTTADGTRIAYAAVGEGPPLMKAANWLSHLEFDWQSPIWRHMLAEFARDHTFIRYDERGNGLSDWNAADLSFDAWVEDLDAVVQAAGLNQFPLLGISQGGAVAIAYAVRHPEKVSHLILYGSYARGWAKRDSPEEIEQRQAQLTLVKLGWGKDNPAFRQLWTTLYAPDATPQQARSFNDLQRISTSPDNAVRLLTEMGNINVIDLLPQVKVPTLVLHCRDESGVPFEEGRKLAGSIPGARFVPLRGRNHLLLEGDPSWGTFVKEVRRFIGAQETSALTFLSDSAKRVKPDLTRSDLPERYSIISFLGVGGMGEVYLAQDNKLGRKVALKTLPTEFTNNQERLRRFQHEARAASALNHPNLLTIHEIGDEKGAHFIATEYVNGETLRAKIKRGQMKIDEALDVAQQTAFALTAAHGAGIVHRDIKPENIMVRQDGIVKVLDFGLAKLLEDQAREIDTEADTRALVLTDPGRVLGTPAYMSPEQARAAELDERTDIWSLGVVLYEMVAGRPPFRGDTRSHTVVSILETEPPPLSRFAPDTPPELQRIVRKALTKDRDSRYQTSRDLMIDLKNLRRELDLQSEMQRSSGPTTSPNGPETVAQAPPAVSTQSVGESTQFVSAATYEQGSFAAKLKRHKVALIVSLIALLVTVPLGLSLAALIAYRRAGKTEPIPIRSVAVLPFVNEGGNADADYLSDGISESLINSLSQLPSVKVIARSSSFKYKGKEFDPQEVSQTLGVEAIVTGRVLQRGDNLRISVELMNAGDKTQMWGERYERKLTDILAVQEEISRDVSEKLRLKLTGEQQQLLSRAGTTSAEAYELYLKGGYFSSKGTEDGFKKAIDYYHQAIEKDPNYALAYVGVANAYRALGSVLGYSPPTATVPQSRIAVMKALAIDESLADAHAVLGSLKITYDWDWPGAEREFKRALQLNPNHAGAHSSYGTYLQSVGRFDEAFNERERSRQLDPTSAIAIANVGYPLYYARRFDQAVQHYHKALELEPTFSWGHLWIGQVYVQQKRYDEAIAEIKKAIALSNGHIRDIATLGHAYAVAGNRSEALKIISELQERAKKEYVSPYFIAIVYAGLDDRDQAFTWLDKAYQERHPYLSLIKVEPVFDHLHSDPRFGDLVRRIGLPQ